MTKIITGPHGVYGWPWCFPEGPHHQVWPDPSDPIWEFDWYLGCEPEGLQISRAYFRGRDVFYKATTPILRVQYDPIDHLVREFRDHLNWQNSHWIDIYEGVATNAPVRYIAIDTYYNRGIGNYRILQRWVLWENGVIDARVFSRGEQWPANHRHHIYWRFDFDIDHPSNNLVLEWQGYGNYGYGDGWLPLTIEAVRNKQEFLRPDGSTDGTSWAVIDKDTGSGYQISPGENDGVADAFSAFDLAVERYHGWEDDLPCRIASAQNDQVADLINGESVDGEDVVVWYVGHLFHDVSDIGRDWHETGARLIPIQLSVPPPNAPTVKIIMPISDPNLTFSPDQPITFQATVQTAPGITIAEDNILWNDSSDGFLGSGSVIQHTLSGGVPAVHLVTVSVTDSAGGTASDSVRILVSNPIT
ncbi:hypothetical protein [Burkholderia ubonensis]|uniref:hypothetical protein n=1 Tax=Burkholderia ubonensis TaxID=101571 RepID=UPI000B2D14A7|nr:hypothetical protein [Burkholderia ubonensis]